MYKIGIFDSGIGGLTILEEVKKIMPNENIIYYKDSTNNPYGSKSVEELQKIASNIVDHLISKGVKEIIVACNTATTMCIKYLREKYKNIIFIGTEPAIKVATDNGYKNILIISTPNTAKSTRLNDLIEANKTNEKINVIGIDDLAHAIEIDDKEKINEILEKELNKYKDNGIDAVVLGCTHYCYIKDEIRKILGNISIIDGNAAIARQAKKKLEENNLLSNSKEQGIITIE